MKAIAFLALSASAQAAFASFEMMLIPSSDGRVYRIDPQNEISLGSFDCLPGLTGVVTNGGNTGYVIGGNLIGAYNLSLGEPAGPIAAYQSSWPSIYHSAGYIYTSEGSSMNQYNASTLVGTGFGNPTGFTLMSMAQTAAGIRGYGKNAAGDLIYYDGSTNGILTGSPHTMLTSAGWNSAAIGQAGFNAAADTSAFMYTKTTGFGMFRKVGANAGTITFSTTIFDPATIPAVAFGHDTMYVVGKSSTAGKTRVLKMRTGSTVVIQGNFELDFDAPTGNKYSVGMVVAPEPASMISLGLGAAALLRRRRR